MTTAPSNRLQTAHWTLIRDLAWKNIRLRYRGSLLGFLWALLSPLLFLLIFLFVFRRAFPAIPNYPVFALTGLIFWTFFATVSGHILGSLVENAGVLKSMAVPPLAFPLGHLLAGLLNLLLSFLPFGFILFNFGWRPQPVHLLVVPITLLLSMFLFGVGLGLCALNVYFRDIGLLWSTLLPALFYLTPIAYPPSLLPTELAWVAALNPLYHFIGLVRTVLVDGLLPGWDQWVSATWCAALGLVSGLLIHQWLRRGYVANY
jgi:ABC-2 type transport system permease protein